MDTEHCRAKARELREQARTAKDTSACAHLVVMAGQYDWLAENGSKLRLSGARPSNHSAQRKGPAERAGRVQQGDQLPREGSSLKNGARLAGFLSRPAAARCLFLRAPDRWRR
jgi:hypothetical protein